MEEILHQLIGRLSDYLQGLNKASVFFCFVYSLWCPKNPWNSSFLERFRFPGSFPIQLTRWTPRFFSANFRQTPQRGELRDPWRLSLKVGHETGETYK